MILLIKILFGMGFSVFGAFAWARVAPNQRTPKGLRLALCAGAGAVATLLVDNLFNNVGDPFVTKSLMTMTFGFCFGYGLAWIMGRLGQ